MNVFGMNEAERDKIKKERKIMRNEFETVGKYGMPLVKKQDIDVDKVELWGYGKAKPYDEEYKDKTIHFFMYDWDFESVYAKPDTAMEKLDSYYALLTPDFSCYYDMPLALQIYSTFLDSSRPHEKLKPIFSVIASQDNRHPRGCLLS